MKCYLIELSFAGCISYILHSNILTLLYPIQEKLALKCSNCVITSITWWQLLVPELFLETTVTLDMAMAAPTSLTTLQVYRPEFSDTGSLEIIVLVSV